MKRTRNELLKRVCALALVAIALGTLWACGGDSKDDVPPPGGDGSGSELTEEARGFVGYWSIAGDPKNQYPQYFLFNADGSCKIGYRNYNDVYPRQGSWAFDPSTNILATSEEGWQYKITLKTANNWTGLMLGEDQISFSFQRGTNREALQELLYGKWVNDAHDTVTISEGNVTGACLPEIPEKPGYFTKYHSFRLSEMDNAPDEWSFDYAIQIEVREIGDLFYVAPEDYDYGTIHVENPYESNMKLTFTGFLQDTYTRISQ